LASGAVPVVLCDLWDEWKSDAKNDCKTKGRCSQLSDKSLSRWLRWSRTCVSSIAIFISAMFWWRGRKTKVQCEEADVFRSRIVD